MTILFYRSIGGPAPGAPLPFDVAVRVWRPAEHGPPPPGSKIAQNLVWWVFSICGIFSRPQFAEMTLWRGRRLVHRLIVTPPWYRFPFMGPDDVQIGDVWTDPDVRAQGLARAAIAEAHRAFAGERVRIWYLTDERNTASRRLIESCGYQRIAKGKRTRPLGLSLIGRFQIDSPG